MSTKQKPKTKTCNTCKKRKKLDDFNKDRTKADGVRNHCKECRRARERKRSADRRQEIREKSAIQKAYDGKRSDANRAAILALINKHRSEFQYLTKNEYRKRGLLDSNGKPQWQGLVSFGDE